MLTTNDVTKIYDTILSIPGMNETVKVDMRISRENILILHNVINIGLTMKDNEKSSGLLENMPPESLQELKAIADEYLTKAGLIDLNNRLKDLSKSK